ncbi:MAG: (d)CMP kinase [Eubacterium sp.]|nr:(d)CMP kinase [Eubacterium sp.]
MKAIAIDGPAGAGKSTIAKMVAKNKGIVYVDTGAMYRTMALACIEEGIDPDDEQKVSDKVADIPISIVYRDDTQHVMLGDQDVSDKIRNENIGNAASKVARYKKVRERLVSLQRAMANEQEVVMDGRDIGTVVLPDASCKIYLTASVEVRAKRRFDELTEKGQTVNITEIEEDIRLRDEQDMNRKESPLKQAEDAVYVDTSDMTIEDVVKKIEEIYDGHKNS